jgi:hypothetical protein
VLRKPTVNSKGFLENGVGIVHEKLVLLVFKVIKMLKNNKISEVIKHCLYRRKMRKGKAIARFSIVRMIL